MDLKEMYQILDASLDVAIRNHTDEAELLHQLAQFRESNPYREIMEAYRAHDVINLYEAANSLREISEALAFNKLADAARLLCTVTRYKTSFNDEEVNPLVEGIVSEYHKVINLLNDLA